MIGPPVEAVMAREGGGGGRRPAALAWGCPFNAPVQTLKSPRLVGGRLQAPTRALFRPQPRSTAHNARPIGHGISRSPRRPRPSHARQRPRRGRRPRPRRHRPRLARPRRGHHSFHRRPRTPHVNTCAPHSHERSGPSTGEHAFHIDHFVPPRERARSPDLSLKLLRPFRLLPRPDALPLVPPPVLHMAVAAAVPGHKALLALLQPPPLLAARQALLHLHAPRQRSGCRDRVWHSGARVVTRRAQSCHH